MAIKKKEAYKKKEEAAISKELSFRDIAKRKE